MSSDLTDHGASIPEPTPEEKLEIERDKVARLTEACKGMSLAELFEVKTAVYNNIDWQNRKIEIINDELKGRW